VQAVLIALADMPRITAAHVGRLLVEADGPDAVHRRQVARAELRQYTNEKI